MKIIFNLLLIPIKIMSYLWICSRVYLSKGNYIIVRIPSYFTTSKKSFFAKLLQKEDKKEIFLVNFLEYLKKISENPQIKKILFIIETPNYGFSEIENIAFYIQKINQKQQTYGYALTGDMRSLYLLSHINKRFCLESSEFQPFLFSREVFFWNGLLKKLGVKVESFQSGPYKSFAESFTRENFSSEAKQNIEAVFDSLNQNFNFILEKFHLSKENFQKPTLRAKTLKELDFIKDFSTENDFLEFYDKNKEYKKASTKFAHLYSKKYNFSFKLPKKGKIAIIPLKGSITLGKSSETQFKSKSIQYYPFKKILEEIQKDDSIKGVILEIDSPGGSAFASELIYQEILQIRKEKKVYAYLQNVAASGGYYIACACERIYANSFTITGSIGTVMIRPNLKDFYHKMGITKDIVFDYPMRDIFSEYENLSEESRKYLNDEIKLEEEKFYHRVMVARNKNREDMNKIGQGRVFSAKDFLQKEMIDSLSTLNETAEELKDILKIDQLKTHYYTAQNSLRDNIKGIGLRVVDLKFLKDLNKISQLEKGINYIDMRFY